MDQKVHYANDAYYQTMGDEQAFCRFTRWAVVTLDPSEVNCGHCIKKMKKHGIHPKETT